MLRTLRARVIEIGVSSDEAPAFSGVTSSSAEKVDGRQEIGQPMMVIMESIRLLIVAMHDYDSDGIRTFNRTGNAEEPFWESDVADDDAFTGPRTRHTATTHRRVCSHPV